MISKVPGLWRLLVPEIAFVVFSVSLLAGLLAFAFRPRIYRLLEIPLVAGAVYFVAAIACLQYLLWVLGYLFIPTYSDHVEPTVAVVAELLLRGQQIYPSWRAGEGLYGMIYGPILYLIHAGPLLVSKSIFATKIAGVLAVCGALIVVALEVWRLTRNIRIAVVAVGCTVLVLLKFGHFSFWNRPEPFLILLSALTVPALRLRRYQAAVVIGLITGLAIGLKAHAALFYAPAILALMIREQTFAAAFRVGAVAGVSAAAVALAPFIYPNVSLSGYFEYLHLSVGHGISFKMFRNNAIHLAFMTAPAFVVYFLLRPNWSSDVRWFALTLLACTVAVAVVGSKAGAGVHHLLPLLPFAVYMSVRAGDPDRRRTIPEIGNHAALSFFILYLCVLAPFALESAYWEDRRIIDSRSDRAVVQEAITIYTAYPQAEMGVSDEDSYKWTAYRVAGVLRGTPVHLEIPYLMDLRAVDLGGSATEQLIEDCKVPEWILPVDGVPFSKQNGYETGGALFSDKFREDFNKHYRTVFKGKYYAVWSCRGDVAGSSRDAK